MVYSYLSFILYNYRAYTGDSYSCFKSCSSLIQKKMEYLLSIVCTSISGFNKQMVFKINSTSQISKIIRDQRNIRDAELCLSTACIIQKGSVDMKKLK